MHHPRTVKRRNAEATRAAILAAARLRFLVESYDTVGLRDVAGDAGVDVALISRYFGGKDGLFRDVLREGKRHDMFEGVRHPSELAPFLARLVAEDDDAERQRRMDTFIILLRSASSPKAGEIIREVIHDDILHSLTALIGGPDAELRARMLLAMLMGISVLRTVMQVDAFCTGETAGVERLQCMFNAALA